MNLVINRFGKGKKLIFPKSRAIYPPVVAKKMPRK